MQMINLAGDINCNEQIKIELDEARIPHCVVDEGVEVPRTIGGALLGMGDFRFYRAAVYWIAVGNVPLPVARILHYAGNGYGKLHFVRADGHCLNPPPENHAVFNDRSFLGEIPSLLVKAKDIRDKCSDGHLPLRKRYAAGRLLKTFRNKCIGTDFEKRMFIELYHIDTQAGLNFFSHVIRHYLEDPAWILEWGRE